ncbi:DUF6318 family protein [Cellulomonas palmilytica]|uniref:DUF6318 family protein n=1 Tax=Cellulomonas palmilytica TaxID=2608402 RepID=UPI001F2713E4|nr:DUF6318 family protein [Cellulomonas palmilytica]UJP40100.1 hypothetical protein F1D97_00640 [Cellulomonas palmilytica]
MGALATALIVATLGLTACSGEQPDPGPTITTVAAPSPSPTPTPSARPTPSPSPEAAEFDASVPPKSPKGLSGPPSSDAALEVAQYFMSLFPYAQATGDLEAWNSLSGEFCDYCANAGDMVEDLSEGQHSVGGRIEFTETRATEIRAGEYGVLLRFTEHPSATLDASGAVVEDFPKTSRVVADMHVVWRDGRWSIEAAAVDLRGQT